MLDYNIFSFKNKTETLLEQIKEQCTAATAENTAPIFVKVLSNTS